MLEGRHEFFIREHAGLMKLHDTYDILDPQNEKIIGQAHEEISGLVKFFRFFINKQLMPTTVEVREKPSDRLIFSLHRPVSFWRSRVEVFDENDEMIGYFKSKLFALGGGFWVHDHKDEQFAEVKGNWVGWEFKFLTPKGRELGKVAKKWAGLAKTLFTSADNYMVSLDPELENRPTAKILLLAAALAIDIVYYERKG